MRDIQLVLERYGAWVAADHDRVNWNSIAAGFSSLLPSTKKAAPQCCDEDGLAIDGAMQCLLKNNSYLYGLIEMYYVNRLPLRVMGNKLGISHNEVSVRLQCAEGFIDGCLAVADVVLEMDGQTRKENIYEVTKKKVV